MISPQRRLDLVVLVILAMGAGCGLVYEYLLSHYAGRVLGAVEVAIYGVITVMMVFMGVGSFLARKIANPYVGFAWLEVLLALVGATSVLLIGSLFALAELFPNILMETFSMSEDLRPVGGLIAVAQNAVKLSPYIVGAGLGTRMGMEIPPSRVGTTARTTRSTSTRVGCFPRLRRGHRAPSTGRMLWRSGTSMGMATSIS